MSQNRNRQQEREIYICGLILLGLLVFWLAAEHFLGLEFSLPPCVFHSLTDCTARAAEEQGPAVCCFPVISFSLFGIIQE